MTRSIALRLAVDCERMAAAFSQLGGDGPAVSLMLTMAALSLRAGQFDQALARASIDPHFAADLWRLDDADDHPHS
jgi:hypothetical protein